LIGCVDCVDCVGCVGFDGFFFRKSSSSESSLKRGFFFPETLGVGLLLSMTGRAGFVGCYIVLVGFEVFSGLAGLSSSSSESNRAFFFFVKGVTDGSTTGLGRSLGFFFLKKSSS
jgi:hypothetical protein